MKRLALLLALAGCSSVSVSADRDPAVDFSRLHAYAWMKRAPTSDPIAENTLVRNRVRDAVDAALAAKGYAKDDAGRADFLVDFETVTRRHVDVRSWPMWPHRRFGWGGWNEVEVDEYAVGTLVVGAIDPKTNDLIWRGTASRVLEGDSGSQTKIDEAVKALFEKFPSASR